jgi:hypothetical protein
VRVIDRIHRDRLAVLFTILAIASVISGATAGALVHIAAAWVFPTAGLIAYGFLAARAMLFWQGRRALPRPPLPHRRTLSAPALTCAKGAPRLHSGGEISVVTAKRPRTGDPSLRS